ncbi:hypothetical protein QLX08_000864 [Tetragonisca angustula]|uniref:Uncharacterized protein n=1 Tax=Tetragonisca angustula TaxID=166442 RepID=A0AAW1AKM6_9HYME
MALAGRILQTNVNHSARAQDLLAQTMVDLTVIAEPYKVTDRPEWAANALNTVAIIRGGHDPSPRSEL